MKTRPYQSRAIDAIHEEWTRHQSTLLVMATGLGKTVTFAHVIARARGRCMVIAHREELIRQAAAKIEAVTGEPCDIEMADERADTHMFRRSKVVVASKDTLHPRRLARFDARDFDRLIIDEAHHAPAPTYQSIIGHFKANPECKILGVTATPDRTDEQAMGLVFDSVAMVGKDGPYDILDGINDGWLVPVEQHFVQVESLDFSGVGTLAGDFNSRELSDLMEWEKNLHGVADPLIRLARWKKTIVFAASVAHAERIAEILNRHRAHCARVVTGATPPETRSQTLADYRAGEFQFLVNVGVFTEGFDEPGIEMIAVARPTKSRALYCLDSKTEILTNKGWRSISDDFDADELAAAFDLKESSIHWSPILAQSRHFTEPDEPIYGVQTGQVDIAVTNGHRMVVRTRTGRRRVRTSWNFVPAADAASIHDAFEIPVCGSQGWDDRLPLTDDEIRFIGLWMTDGNLNPANGAVTLYQSERYPDAIEYIERTLAGCGFKFGRDVTTDLTNFGERKNPLHRWWVSRGKPRGRDKDKRGWGALAPYMEKELPPIWEKCSRAQLLILIEAMNVGDGWKHRPATWTRRTLSICTSRRVLADRLQSLCIRRHIRCNLGVGGTKACPMVMLHINEGKATAQIGTTKTDRPCFKEIRRGRELVWCIQVDTGAIVTRRNGKVAVVGNSQMIGRGTRPLPGIVDAIEDTEGEENEGPALRKAAIARSRKPTLEVLDFEGNAGRHKLVTTADILGGNYEQEVIEKAEEKARGGRVDMQEALEEAAKEIHEAKEAARRQTAEKRRPLVGRAEFSRTRVDPFSVFEIEPWRQRGWDKNEPVTDGQKRMLENFGIPTDGINKRQASQLIDAAIDRRGKGLCTFRQAKILRRRGIDTANITFAEATKRIDEISKRENWGARVGAKA